MHGVVHTLGTLLEGTAYKKAIADGSIVSLLGSMFAGSLGLGKESNPLTENTEEDRAGSYDVLNRDSGLSCYHSRLLTSSD